MAAGEKRSTSGNAVTTTPTANFNSADNSFVVADATGYPDGTNGPFFVKVDSETIKITGRTGTTFNVQTVPTTGRGWEGTNATSHTTASIVNLVFTSTDADEANDHRSNVTADNHTQYLNNARHDTTTRHPASVLPLGSPGNSAPGDTSSAGTASSVARSDHRHGREADTGSRTGVTLSVAALNLPSTTITAVPWVTETVDTDAFIVTNSSNTTLTVPAGKGGIYSGTVNGVWSTTFSENTFVYVNISGNSYVGSANSSAFTGNAWSFSFGAIPITATQTITVSLLQLNAATKTTSVVLNLYRVAA